MPGEIPTVNTNNARQSSSIDLASTLAKGLGLSEKATEAVKEVASLLGNRNVSVTTPTTPRSETGTVGGATGAPVLDNPDDEKAKEINLEKLVSYLQLESEKGQTESAKSRIESIKGELELEYNDRKEKIEKSIKDMEKAASSRTRNKVFGWLMTGLAVIGAVVACIATGGIAVGAVIGAGIALGAQILNETGVMDKIVSGISKGLQSLGMSKQAADIVAQVAITVAIIAASVGAGVAGGVAASANAGNGFSNAAKIALEVTSKALKIGAGVLGATSTVSNGVGVYQNYKSGMSEAALKETEKYITAIQQKLEEAEDELQQILEQIQSLIGQIAQMLSSQSDTVDEIALQIGQMA